MENWTVYFRFLCYFFVLLIFSTSELGWTLELFLCKVDWLIGRSCDQLIDCLFDWLIDWLAGCCSALSVSFSSRFNQVCSFFCAVQFFKTPKEEQRQHGRLNLALPTGVLVLYKPRQGDTLHTKRKCCITPLPHPRGWMLERVGMDRRGEEKKKDSIGWAGLIWMVDFLQPPEPTVNRTQHTTSQLQHPMCVLNTTHVGARNSPAHTGGNIHPGAEGRWGEERRRGRKWETECGLTSAARSVKVPSWSRTAVCAPSFPYHSASSWVVGSNKRGGKGEELVTDPRLLQTTTTTTTSARDLALDSLYIPPPCYAHTCCFSFLSSPRFSLFVGRSSYVSSSFLIQLSRVGFVQV